MSYLITILIILISWLLLHELSHLTAAKLLTNLISYRIYPYPHTHDGHFYWARITMEYAHEPSDHRKSAILFAPRILDTFFISLMVFTCILPPSIRLYWLIFCSGGIIDLFIGSLGISNTSDLRKMSQYLGIKSWWLRIAGFIACGHGLVILTFLLIKNWHNF